MKTSNMLIAAAAAASLAGVAFAQETPPAEGQTTATPSDQQAGGSFDTLDSNKDGRISMPEASADPKLVESFSTADKNGDGYLDSTEFDSSKKPQQ